MLAELAKKSPVRAALAAIVALLQRRGGLALGKVPVLPAPPGGGAASDASHAPPGKAPAQPIVAGGAGAVTGASPAPPEPQSEGRGTRPGPALDAVGLGPDTAGLGPDPVGPGPDAAGPGPDAAGGGTAGRASPEASAPAAGEHAELHASAAAQAPEPAARGLGSAAGAPAAGEGAALPASGASPARDAMQVSEGAERGSSPALGAGEDAELLAFAASTAAAAPALQRWVALQAATNPALTALHAGGGASDGAALMCALTPRL